MLTYQSTTEQHLVYLRGIEKMKLIIYRKDTGYWQTDYHVHGRRSRKQLPFTKLSQRIEARAFAKELYIKELRGELFEECKITFKEMAEIFLRDKSLREKSKKYRLNILYKFIGNVCLNDITYLDYEAIKKHLRKDRGIKNQSINHYLADIGGILNLAKKQRIIKDFPPVVMLDKESSREVNNLTKEQLEQIYAVLPDYLKDPFEFSWRTGLRRSNLVGLKRKHLKLREDGKYKLNFKAEEMKIGIPFEHICTQEETEIIDRNVSLEHEHIFRRPKVNGAKTNHLGDFKKAINTAREKCGFYWTWHWLRHTCATQYALNGVQEQVMNKLMAWSPKSRMAGNYSHVRDEEYLAELRSRLADLRHAYDTKKNIKQIS